LCLSWYVRHDININAGLCETYCENVAAEWFKVLFIFLWIPTPTRILVHWKSFWKPNISTGPSRAGKLVIVLRWKRFHTELSKCFHYTYVFDCLVNFVISNFSHESIFTFCLSNFVVMNCYTYDVTLTNFKPTKLFLRNIEEGEHSHARWASVQDLLILYLGVTAFNFLSHQNVVILSEDVSKWQYRVIELSIQLLVQ
jgi:hypothetical protein